MAHSQLWFLVLRGHENLKSLYKDTFGVEMRITFLEKFI